MISAIAEWTAAWGFLGALCYAAPHTFNCWFSEKPGGRLKCLIAGAIALIVGTAASIPFAPWLCETLHMDGTHNLRAVAAAIGLVAYSAGPKITQALGERFVGLVKGTGK